MQENEVLFALSTFEGKRTQHTLKQSSTDVSRYLKTTQCKARAVWSLTRAAWSLARAAWSPTRAAWLLHVLRDLLHVFFASLKARPNDRNMPTQHIATLLGATCCVRLATLLRHVASCWVLLVQLWPFPNWSQQHPTCRNTSQHGGQTHPTCCAQQCCNMLRWHVAIVWPGLYVITTMCRPW